MKINAHFKKYVTLDRRNHKKLKLFIFRLNISIFTTFSCMPLYAQNPSTPEACLGLESNVDRLNCYDFFFKPLIHQLQVDSTVTKKIDVDEDHAATEINNIQAKPNNIQAKPNKVRQKINQNLTNLFSLEMNEVERSHSLLDSRWELSKESKLGTWNLRAYQPIYILPAFWSSDKNEFPHSPNLNNTVDQDQNLKSLEAKFQLSLKTKALENIVGDNGDLWIGFTQSARWQVYNEDESRPFRETNYEPEASLMFRTNYHLFGLNGRLLGLSLNHQSNGRSDPLSRSWNRIILNLGLEKNNFTLMLRPWYRLDEDAKDDNNPDIKDYVGRGDLTAFYRKNNHDFSLLLRHSLKGGDKSHGAIQFDWSFPISGKLRGHFQLFDGYGESLIDYNHRATYAGIGVSLMNWY
ncbi:phospholipase A [Acinetobacter gerneri]